MCDEEDVWQVAGHRRRRNRPGSESSKPKIRRRAGQQLSHATPSATNTNTKTSSTTRGAHCAKDSAANSGFSYSARAGRGPSRKQPGQQQQQQQAGREELVRIELQKLEQVKSLLMQTALWQRLVEGLESILPQLGLALPPPEKRVAISEPADVELPLQSGKVPANTALRGEALLEGRCGDAAEASRIAAAVWSGGRLDEVDAWCLGAGPGGAATGRAGTAAAARVGGGEAPPPTPPPSPPAATTIAAVEATEKEKDATAVAAAAAAATATAPAHAETPRAAAAARLQGRPTAHPTSNQTMVGVASAGGGAAANSPPSQQPQHSPEPRGSSSRSACATRSCRTNRGRGEQKHHHSQQQQQQQQQMLCKLVCYGIGNFSENHSSRYQLALALCLRDLLFPATKNAAAGPADTATATGGSDATSGTKSGFCCSSAAAGGEKVDTFEPGGSDSPRACQAGPTTTPSRGAAAATAQGVVSLGSPRSSGNKRPSTSAVSQQREGAPPSPPPPPPPRVTPSRVQGVSTPRPEVLVFDPVMGDAERSILAALGCGTLENEEGKRCCYDTEGAGNGEGGGCCYGMKGGAGKGGGNGCCCGVEGEVGNGDGDGCCCGVEDEAGKGGGDGDANESREIRRRRPTLFFMPHCPQRLYSNVLWANWSSPGLGSIIILGNKMSSYRDRTLSTTALADATNAILRSEPLIEDIELLPYRAADKKRSWRRDVERLPQLERAFNDLALSFSSPGARASAAGVEALRDRPLEFVEEVDGELITGRVGLVGASV